VVELVGGYFKLYDTYGFPAELSKEEAYKHDVTIDDNADSEFERLMSEQRDRSRRPRKVSLRAGLAVKPCSIKNITQLLI